MTLGDLVARMADRLERAGIPYMVTGSLASSFHGEPRTTRDVDLVIDPTPQALTAFVGRLPASEFSVDADAARVALQERSQFNIVEVETGWKVDFLVRKDRPFSVEEFERRMPAELLGHRAFIATAEDTIMRNSNGPWLAGRSGSCATRLPSWPSPARVWTSPTWSAGHDSWA